MSRSFGRRQSPDDDLLPATQEELRKHKEAATGAGPSHPTLAGKPADHAPHPADRADYFAGHYAPVPGAAQHAPPDATHTLDQRLAEFQLPPSLSPCVADLLALLHEHGLEAALRKLRHDGRVNPKQADAVKLLLVSAQHSGQARKP
jgi:hypothetical protein